MLVSTVSGSMPCDIVRLPWGSMSMQRTLWPSSAKAAERFSVVVVFATPPFWLAKAMTLAFFLVSFGVSVMVWRAPRFGEAWKRWIRGPRERALCQPYSQVFCESLHKRHVGFPDLE